MKTYLVGGAIRDSLLKLPIKDKDWVVVGGTPNMLLEQGYQQIGRDFPVFLHPKTREEYALARTEYKSGRGYTGFVTRFTPDVTLEQDLKRRDLTINAIAQDENGNYIDPYQGRQDLEKRILRHVSDAFIEDPLRVLRVARFAACYAYLHFRVSDETMTLMRMMVANGELANLTAERVWKETENALRAYDPQIYFQILRDCGALAVLFPEIDNLFDISVPEEWHLEIDIGVHTLMTVSIAARLTHELDVRFATLCHDIGKVLTPMEKWSSPEGCNHTGIKLVEKICQRLRVPNTFRNLALLAVELHDSVHTINKQPVEHLIALFNRIDAWRKPQRVNQILQISEADALGRTRRKNIHYSQAIYVREAFQVARAVSVKAIIDAGFKGIQVYAELTRRRCAAIKSWRYGLDT